MGFELKDRISVSNVSQTTLSAKTPGASGTTVAERARNKKAADPVCIEMPVRVRGIGGLPIAGTNEIGQDFSEDTRTLIVMATGAVVRMATRVKKGQLLGLKHLRTEQELSCRVVNVRSSGTPEDYVEVEFTQRAVGFWGIRFPNDPKDEPPVVEAAPTPGEVEAERVIFGGGHTERGNVTVGPATVAKGGAKADVKIGADRGSALFADVGKSEPGKAAPVDSPGFSGLSKSAEEMAAAAERIAREDALIEQQARPNIISFPGPATHQEKATIFSEPELQTQPLALDFSPVEDTHPKSGLLDAEIEHAAIAKAIEDKAAAEKAAAERLAAAHAEFERIEAEKRAEAERKTAEAKATRAAAEKAAAEKAAAEKAAAEKAAAEKAAAERLAAAQAEFERREEERRTAERAAAAERSRLFAEAHKKREAERLAAEIAARAETTDDVEVTPSLDTKRRDESLADSPGKQSAGRKKARSKAHGRSVGATAYGTLEEEIQRDRAALKTAKGGHAYLMGAAAGAVFLLLAAGGWWYMHSSAKVETPHAAAPGSLPPSGTPNSPTSGAAAPAGVSDNNAATNVANSNGKGAKGTSALSPDATTAANASNDNAADAAVSANQPAKDDSRNAAKPTGAQSKAALKATLSGPVVVKRNPAAGDVAAPDIEAGPVSGGAAPLIGTVSSTSVAPAAPRTGGQVVPPRLLKAAAAEYPALARQRHIEGDVVIEANVGVNGSITSAKVLSGSELLREAALNAVRQFKYSPAQLDGAPTTSQVLVTVKFHTK